MPRKASLGGDGADELLDVQLGGAALLARRVGTLEAAVGLAQRRTLTQRRMLDVVKVLLERVAIATVDLGGVPV